MVDSLIFNEFHFNTIGHGKIGDYEIDTCMIPYHGYETAIWKIGNHYHMVVVQRYESAEDATEGHGNWLAYCMLNPLAAYSVENEQIELFKDKE